MENLEQFSNQKIVNEILTAWPGMIMSLFYCFHWNRELWWIFM